MLTAIFPLVPQKRCQLQHSCPAQAVHWCENCVSLLGIDGAWVAAAVADSHGRPYRRALEAETGIVRARQDLPSLTSSAGPLRL